ncbi:MAG: hypothetical protein ABIK77_03740 [candidate division WOR-3 bacterium]
MTIRIKYILASLPEDAKEENLRIGLLEPMNCWELLSNSIVDKTNRAVSAATEHFSGVGLLYEIPTTGTIKLAFPLLNRVPYGGSVQQTTDSGYIITGYTYSFGNYKPNVYLIKTDKRDNLLWEKFLPSNRSYSVRQTSDMGYIIVGDIKYYYPHSYMECVDLIKTDENSNLLWKKTFIERSGYGYSVQQTLDGGYIITGSTGTRGVDIYLIKTDMHGNTL